MHCSYCRMTLLADAADCWRCSTPVSTRPTASGLASAPLLLRAAALVIDITAAITAALAPLLLFSAREERPGDWVIFLLLFVFVSMPLWVLYHWVTASLGGGIGKRALGLRIVRISDGQAPGWGSGFLRMILPVVAIIPAAGLIVVPIDAGWMLIDRDRRPFHDVLAGTIVVMDTN